MQTEPQKLSALPKDIELFEIELKEARNGIEKLIKISDGLFYRIGMDAILGVVPGVGGIYTFFASCWMFALAMRVKTPVGDMLSFLLLTIVDIGFGIFPAFGDVLDAFLRVHSWFGNQLLETIDRKLNAIARAKISVTNMEERDLMALKKSLFN